MTGVLAALAAHAAPPRFVEVAAGDAFVCARGVDGSVWCWGDNRSGELGGTTAEDHAPTPLRLELDGVVQVAAARSWAAAVRADGTVWAWGRDGWGMRTGDPAARAPGPRPSRVAGLDDVRQVALGEVHGCARRGDGAVWCWGSDRNGLLGDADRFDATRPPGVGLGPLPGPSGGVTPPGVRVAPPPPTDPRREPAFAPSPVPGLGGVTFVAAFGDRTAAVAEGRVWVWGRGAARVSREWGELGANPVTASEVRPAPVDGLPPARAVALHRDHLLVVATDGSLFGVGSPRWWPSPPSAASGASPVFRFPELGPVEEAAAFAGGAVRTADEVRVWGAGSACRGDGGAGGAPSRVPIRAVSVATGRDFVVVVDEAGAVWGWGAGWAGQLGRVDDRPIGGSAVWTAPLPVRIVGPG